MRIKTAWFAGGKCISTGEPVSALTSSKKMAIESAVGSLNEMHHRLRENSGISQFVARAGSLVFEPAGSFTRCVTAHSEPEAMALMRATYRPQVSSGNGKRTSYAIAAGVEGCTPSNGVDGSPESTESRIPVSDGAGESATTVDPGGIDSIAPYPDPLEVDPSYYDDEPTGDFEEFDLEAIPTSEEFAGEMTEGKLDSQQPSSDSTVPSES